MLGSTFLYVGLVVIVAGVAIAITPLRRRLRLSRAGGLLVAGAGLALSLGALFAPAVESRVVSPATQLDTFSPAWQFREHHTIRIEAPAVRVYDAIRRVSADEIFLFQTLTWLRRGGRQLPAGIMNAPADEPIIDVATRGGFLLLADDAPRELVVGAMVVAPPGGRFKPTPDTFRSPVPPGVALATMNFLVTADGPAASIVSTETRVFAGDDAARRAFAAYWRIIYPGSAVIRRQWLRAIARRATAVE